MTGGKKIKEGRGEGGGGGDKRKEGAKPLLTLLAAGLTKKSAGPLGRLIAARVAALMEIVKLANEGRRHARGCAPTHTEMCLKGGLSP
jgi:hypothetical protein